MRHAQALFSADVDVAGVRDPVGAVCGAEDLNYNAKTAAQWGRTLSPEGIPEAVVLEMSEQRYLV